MNGNITMERSPLYAALTDLADSRRELQRISAAIASRAGERSMTLEAGGVAFDCTFDYEPGERGYVSDVDGGHPGYPASYSLTSAVFAGKEFVELLSPSAIAGLEERAAQ